MPKTTADLLPFFFILLLSTHHPHFPYGIRLTGVLGSSTIYFFPRKHSQKMGSWSYGVKRTIVVAFVVPSPSLSHRLCSETAEFVYSGSTYGREFFMLRGGKVDLFGYPLVGIDYQSN